MIGTMPRKKREGGKVEQAGEDRHLSHRMVRLPVAYHERLKELAKRHKRPLTWEVLLALDGYFRENGVEPPGEG
jgi:hypothetical protein